MKTAALLRDYVRSMYVAMYFCISEELVVAELKIVEWLELVSLVSDNVDTLECWLCMVDTELVNGDSGSSDTSMAVRSSVESGRHTDEHSPSCFTTSGTVAHATGPSSGPTYPSKSSSLSESHDITSIILYSKEQLDQRIF